MSKYTQLNEGLRLMAEGDEKFNHKGWFGGNKWDEAADLYGRAGNAFKLQKQFKESGDAYKKQGEVREKLNERDEASNCYLNASKSYKKEFPQGSLFDPEAATTLTLAISILIEKGRFSAAASSQKQLAEIYESDLADLQKAMDAYDQAGEWYSAEDASAQANACFLKVAQFAGTLENYDRAIRIFEQVAEKSLGNNLTKWSVREYFLKAGICHLCSEVPFAHSGSLQGERRNSKIQGHGSHI
jgi:alpha-soluble NSF attachment protein